MKEASYNLRLLRYAKKARVPAVADEGVLIQIQIDESTIARWNTDFHCILRLAQTGKHSDGTWLIGDVIGNRTAHPLSAGTSARTCSAIASSMKDVIRRREFDGGRINHDRRVLSAIRSYQASSKLH